jgi:hypothetical protein
MSCEFKYNQLIIIFIRNQFWVWIKWPGGYGLMNKLDDKNLMQVCTFRRVRVSQNLKGQWHQNFSLWVLSFISPIWTPKSYPLIFFLIYFEIHGDILKRTWTSGVWVWISFLLGGNIISLSTVKQIMVLISIIVFAPVLSETAKFMEIFVNALAVT